MPTTKQRPPASTVVPKNAIQQAGQSLQDLPEKPKESWSLREAVSVLQEDITLALNRGYSYEEVVALLAKSGVSITVSSLKRYLAAAKRSNDGGAKTRTRRVRRNSGKVSAKQSAAASAALKGEEEEETEEAAPSRRRKTGTATKATKAPAKSTSKTTKTAAKASPKATAKAKAAPRSTATRSRKKSS